MASSFAPAVAIEEELGLQLLLAAPVPVAADIAVAVVSFLYSFVIGVAVAPIGERSAQNCLYTVRG